MSPGGGYFRALVCTACILYLSLTTEICSTFTQPSTNVLFGSVPFRELLTFLALATSGRRQAGRAELTRA